MIPTTYTQKEVVELIISLRWQHQSIEETKLVGGAIQLMIDEYDRTVDRLIEITKPGIIVITNDMPPQLVFKLLLNNRVAESSMKEALKMLSDDNIVIAGKQNDSCKKYVSSKLLVQMAEFGQCCVCCEQRMIIPLRSCKHGVCKDCKISLSKLSMLAGKIRCPLCRRISAR